MHLLYTCLSALSFASATPTDSLPHADSLPRLRSTPYAYQIAANNRLPGLVSHPLLAFKGLLPGLLVRPGSADPNQAPILHWRGIASVFQNESQPALWVDGLPTLGVEDQAADDWDTLSLYHSSLVPGALGTGAGLGTLGITTKRARWGADGRAVRGFGVSALGGQSRPITAQVLTADEFREVVKRNRQNWERPDQGANTDWIRELTRRPLLGQLGVSATGGSRHLGYYASMNYLNNPGVARRTDYERLSVRLNTDSRWLNDRLQVSLDGLFTTARRQYTDRFAFFQSTIFPPTSPVYQTNGNFTEYPGSFILQNPVGTLTNTDSIRRVQTVQARGQIRYQLLPGFVVKATIGLTSVADSASMVEKRYAYLTNFPGANRQWNTTQRLLSNWFTVHYNRNRGQSNISAEAGYGFVERRNNQRLFWPRMLYDYRTQRADTISKPDTILAAWRTVSFYGQLTYAFAQRLIISGQIRRDGASLYGPANKWGNYGAVDVQYILLPKRLLFLDIVRLHAHYGTNWNAVGLGPNYSVATIAESNRYFNPRTQTWVPTVVYNQRDNPNLGPEKQRTAGIGVSFSAWRGRLTGQLEAYNRHTSSGLWRYGLNTGFADFTNQVYNGMLIQNTGFDGWLRWLIMNKKQVNWDATLTFNRNRNKVLDLGEEGDRFTRNPLQYGYERTYSSLRSSWWYSDNLIVVGEPVGTFQGFVVTGTRPTGNGNGREYVLADLNKDGNQWGVEDMRYFGSAQPVWQGSLRQELSIKRVRVSFLLNRQSGNRLVSMNRVHRTLPFSPPYENALRETFDMPANAPVTNGRLLSPFIENASFTRLENVTLTYSLPLPRNQHLDLSLTGWNVKVWTRYRGIDPELHNRGLEPLTYYPYSQSLNVGANWRF